MENIKASSEGLEVSSDGKEAEKEVELTIEHTYSDGTHTYSGTVITPSPCYSVEAVAIVAESYPEKITINITLSAESADKCVEILDEQRFSIDVQASEEAELVQVQVNGELVDWKFD